MNVEKLKQALLKQAKEQIEKYYSDADKEVEKFRVDKICELEQFKAEYNKKMEKELEKKRTEILADANKKARKMLVLAEDEFAKKVYALALAELASLRDDTYCDCFERLVRELPEYHWEEVTVNHQDVSLAAKFFPDVRINVSNRITGGFEVSAKSGTITVNNTFEKRLERAFSNIIVELLKEVYAVIDKKEK